jgi:hypothetical protein
MNLILREFKTGGGAVNFPAILSIKSENRIPAMVKTDYDSIYAAVTVGITLALESMNLVRPMNENQLLDLVDTVLESAEEDNLSLEDLIMFCSDWLPVIMGHFTKVWIYPNF